METARTPATTLLDRVATAANAVGAAALAAVAAVQGWQVLGRYLLNDSPSWTEPLSAVLLCIAMSFGAAVMVHREAHFGFSLLRDAAPPRLRRVLVALVDAVVAALGLALAAGAAVLAIDGWPVAMAGVALPQGAPFVPLALGGALMALFAAAGGVARWRAGARR